MEVTLKACQSFLAAARTRVSILVLMEVTLKVAELLDIGYTTIVSILVLMEVTLKDGKKARPDLKFVFQSLF